MNFFNKTYNIMIGEIRQLKRAPLPFALAFVLPVLAMIVLLLTFRNSILKDIPIAVVDHDNSPLSRMLIRSLDATQAMNVSFVTGSEDEAAEGIESGRTIVTIIIPADLSREVKTGGHADVIVLANGTSLLYSKIVYRSAAMTIMTASAGVQIRRLEAKGLSRREAMFRSNPVTTEIHSVGNPWIDYSIYFIPGIAMALLQMSASFSTLWMFRRHREHAAGRIIPPAGTRFSFFLGKLLPLFIANTLAVVAVYSIVLPSAGIEYNSALPTEFGFTLLFVLVAMGMGALLSILLENLVTGVQISLLINAPSFVFSGFTFPRWAMPDWIQAVAGMIPLTHFLDGFFPMFIYGRVTTTGLVPLLAIGFVFWGGVALLLSPAGDFIRSMFKKPEDAVITNLQGN